MLVETMLVETTLSETTLALTSLANCPPDRLFARAISRRLSRLLLMKLWVWVVTRSDPSDFHPSNFFPIHFARSSGANFSIE